VVNQREEWRGGEESDEEQAEQAEAEQAGAAKLLECAVCAVHFFTKWVSGEMMGIYPLVN
jgi:hypothetical protein